MKFVFFVQGEGRGHMTQALALKTIIEKCGHTLGKVFVGTSGARKIPDYFIERIGAEIIQIKSPNFLSDKKNKSIKIFYSIAYNLFKIFDFIGSLNRINREIKITKPDVIINFYEPLVGLYNKFYNNEIPVICIAHQYIYHHKEFFFPEGFGLKKRILKTFASVTSIRARKKIAQSLYPLKNDKGKLIIIPPFLREEILKSKTSEEDFILVYLLNEGYAEDIIKWHENNKKIRLHCFSDWREIKEDKLVYDETLCFHKLNDENFLDMMSRCKGLVTTAGFDIICEAMYFGKPVFMVPVENQFEQTCNSRNAYKAGAGIYDSKFNISRFVGFMNSFKNNNSEYCEWVRNSTEIVMKEIESAL
ncbi:MAG: glycosyltransferase family protein [Bacteroidales bacterium]|nr:glycosyltransferase family protein [Bacteroidales bacterium]